MKTEQLRHLRRAVLAVTGAAMLILGLAAPSQAADPVLRDLATAKGRYIGSAATASELNISSYAALEGTQFNSATPGNEMKWESVEATRGTYNWTGGDNLVSFAQAHSMQVRGHTLVWHSQLPSWLTSGTFTNDELHALLVKHVTDEVTHFKGKINQWDVVNEPLNEDGTYRASLWYNQLGSSYIADALRAARAADPAAKLYINDYNTDGTGSKSDGMYNLAKSLLAQGVPLDGIGFQGHLIVGSVPTTVQTNLQRFADLGLDVAVTELDVRMTLPATTALLTQQKADFKSVVSACLAVSRCVGVTVWGLGDATSWVPGVFPGQGAANIYDENYQPKPAFYGVAEALGWTGTVPVPTASCAVTYGVNQWNTGFTASVTVKNTGTTPVSGWSLTWTYPSGQKVTQAWNATVVQSGTAVTATNVSYNATIAAGGTQAFGFNASWSGSNPAPADFKLNGTACS
ncbi:endo-1,4-beta-xylanase [Streptomyces sp. NBC_01537]|uniref:endo-1,4-beta-xylanase n=1 Tax=Streptomyces sp. NBC_01537 TaxID=2903896 RepID=UPI00386E1051